jgi:hypothetical protein
MASDKEIERIARVIHEGFSKESARRGLKKVRSWRALEAYEQEYYLASARGVLEYLEKRKR